MQQGVASDAEHGTEEKQQVIELVGGEHRATACRSDAVACQQCHQGQGAAAAAGRGADGEFGGDDHAEAAHAPEVFALTAQQQTQTQGIDDPAQQDHPQQAQHQAGSEGAQALQQVAATEQGWHQQRHDQGQEQPEQAIHRRCLSVSQADLVRGVRPWRSNCCKVCIQ
ncbi:hypothetical protein D9M71_391880 [compost metagenome]